MAASTPSKKSASSGTATPREPRAPLQTPTGDSDDAAAWAHCHHAAATPEIDLAIKTLYQDLDRQIQSRGPTCWVSGRCCNFNAYGHRLYVTALEIAWVLRQHETHNAQQTGDHNAHLDPLLNMDTQGPCPFQTDGLCSVHAIRPLGCRAFFCQQGTQAWQNELYESFLAKLRTLHDTHRLPYRYIEWRSGLQNAAKSLRDARRNTPNQ